MPWASIEAAKKAGAKTTLSGVALSLAQINKMAEMADSIKAKGGAEEPWAVAISAFKKTHKIENGRWVKKEAKEEALVPNIQETLSLSEGQIMPDQDGKRTFRAWWPLLKEGPGNKLHKNYYSLTALESAAKLVPQRNKMFFGHIEGEVKPTGRSVKDWAASVKSTKVENGVLYGLVQAYDQWLKDRMYDAPEELSASIEARGVSGKTREHEGEKWNLIEDIKSLNGFQIVDYPGNTPMGITLTESNKDDTEESMENVLEFKEKYPALYDQVVNETKTAVQAEMKPQIDAKDVEIKKLKESLTADQQSMSGLKESVTKLEAKLDGVEALGKKKDRETKVNAALAALPKEAVTDKFKILVEQAVDEKSALELIEERAKLFDGKVIGHGKTETVDQMKTVKEREAEVLHSLGQKTPEEIAAEKK